MNTSPAAPEATVFYDGLCPICSREVRLYRKLDTRCRVSWRDLREPGTLAGERFSHEAAMALLHVKDAEGRLHIGMQGHLLMWAQLPGLRHLAALLRSFPALSRALDKAYVFFTRYRPGRSRKGSGQ